MFENRRLPDWPLDMTINTVISILATALGSTLYVPISESLGQLKWLHFRNPQWLRISRRSTLQPEVPSVQFKCFTNLRDCGYISGDLESMRCRWLLQTHREYWFFHHDFSISAIAVHPTSNSIPDSVNSIGVQRDYSYEQSICIEIALFRNRIRLWPSAAPAQTWRTSSKGRFSIHS